MPDLSALASLGLGGIIAWLWLVERRAGLARDRRLEAAHRRLMHERTSLRALLRVVEENTRAATALEHAHRALAAMVERLASTLGR